MPLITANDKMPEWSEVDFFEIITLNEGEIKEIHTRSKKELLFVAAGKLLYKLGDKDTQYDLHYRMHGAVLDIGKYRVVTVRPEGYCTLIRIGGSWKEETGSHGFFTLSVSDSPVNHGDPVIYEEIRNTEFDNHYHDFDEYWIIYEGQGKAVSEGKLFDVKAGDCIATRMGDYHDFPVVEQTIKGIWFETTLLGEKRTGHLWKKNIGIK